ncbi:unnamed protein product, partial [Staurois parvus]
ALRRSGGRRTPRWSDSGLGPSGGAAGAGPPGGAAGTEVTRPNLGGSESTGMDRWHSGKTLDRLVWTAGIGVTRHQVIWLEKGSGQRASSGKAEGSEYNWYDRGHWVQTLDRPGWTAG